MAHLELRAWYLKENSSISRSTDIKNQPIMVPLTMDPENHEQILFERRNDDTEIGVLVGETDAYNMLTVNGHEFLDITQMEEVMAIPIGTVGLAKLGMTHTGEASVKLFFSYTTSRRRR